MLGAENEAAESERTAAEEGEWLGKGDGLESRRELGKGALCRVSFLGYISSVQRTGCS